jgi:hypothetical protein
MHKGFGGEIGSAKILVRRRPRWKEKITIRLTGIGG